VTLEDVGNIGELIGAIGVIASLAYLAVQVRQNTTQIERNTRVTKAASYQAMIDALSSMNVALIASADYAEVLHRVRSGEGSVSEPDAIRFRAWVSTLLSQVENVHYQHSIGTLEESRLRVAMPIVDYYMQFAPTREVWATMRDRFDTPFRATVDEIAARYSAPASLPTPATTTPAS
jgi:hypothetical protein